MLAIPFQSPRALWAYRLALINGFDYMRRPSVLVSNIVDHRQMLFENWESTGTRYNTIDLGLRRHRWCRIMNGYIPADALEIVLC